MNPIIRPTTSPMPSGSMPNSSMPPWMTSIPTFPSVAQVKPKKPKYVAITRMMAAMMASFNAFLMKKPIIKPRMTGTAMIKRVGTPPRFDVTKPSRLLHISIGKIIFENSPQTLLTKSFVCNVNTYALLSRDRMRYPINGH